MKEVEDCSMLTIKDGKGDDSKSKFEIKEEEEVALQDKDSPISSAQLLRIIDTTQSKEAQPPHPSQTSQIVSQNQTPKTNSSDKNKETEAEAEAKAEANHFPQIHKTLTKMQTPALQNPQNTNPNPHLHTHPHTHKNKNQTLQRLHL